MASKNKQVAEGKLTSDEIMTGSTSSAVMGVNPWSTPNDALQTAFDSVLGKPRKKLTFEALHWGTQFEVDIVEEALKRLNLKDYKTSFDKGFTHKDVPMAVSLDATSEGNGETIISDYDKGIVCYSENIKLEGPGIIEAKLTSHEAEMELPLYRGRIQLQMAMEIMGCSWGAVAVLHRGIKMITHVFEKDEELINDIKTAAIDFDRRVQKFRENEETEWYDFTTARSASKVFDQASEDTVDLSDMENDIQTIQESRDDIKDLEQTIDVTSARVMARMGDSKYGNAGRFKVVWGEINYRAMPEKLVPAKEARTIRVNKLRIKDA